ncbi:hypothetical protein O1C03_001789 [Vibrio cholerae]|uniref:DUF5666 domain-containing protein n=1 Tax=Vibrio cholerae TaxID=666 RepID=UPI0030803EC1|nr:hypothetical protein [Vibrio cholerae]
MKRSILSSLCVFSLFGCGGENETNSHMSLNIPVFGTVEAVDISTNKIKVNDNIYNVSSVVYKDKLLPISVLKLNMRVSVNALSTNNAFVELEPTFAGEITSINSNGFVVNGIKLIYEGLEQSEIKDGDWVMVFALPTAGSSYKVISVVKFDSNFIEYAEVEGLIDRIDQNKQTLNLGGLVVYYGHAILHQKLDIGQWVEVEGDWTPNGQFYAYEVNFDHQHSYVTDYEFEGVITWVSNDLSSFTLNH